MKDKIKRLEILIASALTIVPSTISAQGFYYNSPLQREYNYYVPYRAPYERNRASQFRQDNAAEFYMHLPNKNYFRECHQKLMHEWYQGRRTVTWYRKI